MKDRLKRLFRLAEGNAVSIPQPDGEPPARFPESALRDAFLNATRRACGADVPEHPLSAAARNSPDPTWRDSVVAGPEEAPAHVEDLSEKT
jgi:hypothetical protein